MSLKSLLFCFSLCVIFACQRPISPQSKPAHPQDPLGILPSAALTAQLDPQGFHALLKSLEHQLSHTPLETPWKKLQLAADDLFQNLTGHVRSPASGLARFGCNPAAPISFSLSSPDGQALGHAQIALMRNQPFDLKNLLVFHARITFSLQQDGFQKLSNTLQALQKRLGFDTLQLAEKPNMYLAALLRDPETGLLITLRRQDTRAALDLLMPAQKKNPIEPLLDALQQGEAVKKPLNIAEFALFPSQMAILESALTSHQSLLRADWNPGSERIQLLESYAEITAECTERWLTASKLTKNIHFLINSGNCSTDKDRPKLYSCPELTLTADLTELGQSAWSGSLGVLVGDEPRIAGYRWAVSRNAFLQLSHIKPEQNADWWQESKLCNLGKINNFLLFPILPALAEVQRLPLLEPACGFPPNPIGLRVELLGNDIIFGQPLPHLVTAVVLESLPKLVQPLGENATFSQKSHQQDWHLEGAWPAHLQLREKPLPMMIFALGHLDPTQFQTMPLQTTQLEEGLFLDGTVKLREIAQMMAASEDKEGVRAIAQLCENWDEIVLQGSLQGDQLTLQLYPLYDSTTETFPTASPLP